MKPLIDKFLYCCLLGFAALLLGFSSPAVCSDASQYQTSRIKNYGVSDGLKQTSVYDIALDQNGYIWLATQSGIDKFDGYNFTNYGQSEIPGKGPSGSLIYNLEVHPSTGDIWIATVNGLNVLRSETQLFELFELYDHEGKSDKSIKIIFIDSEQNIYVGTDKGLYRKRADENGFKIVSMPNQATVIIDVISLNKDKLLVATSNGVLSYNKKTEVWRDEILPMLEVTALEIDNQGYLWAGTKAQGLFRAKIGEDTFSAVISVVSTVGFSNSIINDIQQMNDDSIWVATTRGIFIFPDPNDFSSVNLVNRVNGSETKVEQHVSKLFKTDSGLIFFGTYSSGFSVLDLNSNMFSRFFLYPNQVSYFVTKEADDSLWVATKEGVYKINVDNTVEGPWIGKSEKESINQVKTLAFQEKTNTLWIGSRLGLGKLVPGDTYIKDIGIKNASVYSITVGLDENIWVGTWTEGLYVLDPVSNRIVKNFDLPMATTILPVSDELVLVSTANGLILINPQTDEIRKINNDPEDKNSLVHDVVTWISARDKNSYYVGTQGHGLLLLELTGFNGEAKFSRLFLNTELSTSSIGAVVEDEGGNLWIPTESKILRANLESGRVDAFDDNDGVNSTGYYIGSYAKKNDGTIVFAGDQGVTYFSPELIEKPVDLPSIHFTRIAILNGNDSRGINEKFNIVPNEESTVTRISLSPDDILVSIEFAALEFGSPESIEYAYRLIGFDDRWQFVDSKNRTATYTNLSPGTYILEAKSTNRYGVWNDRPQRMTIQVLPPWWQTVWATITFGLLAIVLVFVIFRWRTYALHKRSVTLYQNVQEKTIELQMANEKLTLLTTLDPLTQVYNRRGFTDAVGKEFSKYKRSNELFSIILIDIDFFKRINDEYGHEAGDQVLIKFANVLAQCMRDYDILARWGGEEFIVLLPNTELKDAINIANKYRERIRNEVFTVADTSLRISLTAGAADIEGYSSVDQCIKRADDLLYEGKNLGRDQVLPML